MAIDPSIIGNVMVPRAPQMPDVNAMMQTRTADMENVYKIERQRAEDAKAAQQAQADEAVKALIPAYAYAFDNPSDLAGALDIAPPELRGSLEPYVAQLQGKPPEQVRAALIGSLASSEVGRAFLETQGRMQTAEIQRGQLDVARQREAREAAAAASGGKVSFRETDAEGNVRLYNAQGNEIGMLPKAGKPAAAAGTSAATESERLAGYNAGRALDAAKRISTALEKDPAASAPGLVETAVGRVADPNILRGEGRQRVAAAQRELIDALLTLATGAAYNREQLEGQMESYIPKWSDQAGTREDKRAALLGLIQNAKVKAGRAWTPEMDAAFQQLLTSPDSAKAAPSSAGAGGELRRYDSTGKRIQ